ncbi:MAG: hypothetical protein HON90_06200, partial [Halobacteriovoraceae bacterium]|nr:hypothetical protein [Halobacteriovoraceae bacterium]
MTLPCFKEININSFDEDVINTQLGLLKLQEQPHIIDLSHMDKHQLEIISLIESFLEAIGHNGFPYPVYILSDYKPYHGNLNVIKDKTFLPRFFNQKTKTLKSKENLTLNKIYLKQENLRGINKGEIRPILDDFWDSQKIIKDLQSEQSFYTKIQNGL